MSEPLPPERVVLHQTPSGLLAEYVFNGATYAVPLPDVANESASAQARRVVQVVLDDVNAKLTTATEPH
jgi:hypothetical protein